MPALALRIEETFIFANAIVVDPFIVFVTVFAIQTLTARTIASTAAPSIPAAAPAAIAFPDLRVLLLLLRECRDFPLSPNTADAYLMVSSSL
jgi:hypothetical protein